MYEETKATIEILNSYYQKGGFYNIPVEVVNDVIGMLEKQTELIGKLEMEKSELFNKAVEENIKIRDKKDEEIEKLYKSLQDINNQLTYLETYSSKEDVYEDMKRRLNNIETIVNKVLKSGDK